MRGGQAITLEIRCVQATRRGVICFIYTAQNKRKSADNRFVCVGFRRLAWI